MLSILYQKSSFRTFIIHFFVWVLVLSFPVINTLTGEGTFKVWRIVVPVSVFYFNYSYLVPRLLLRSKRLLYIGSIIILIITLSYILMLLDPLDIPPLVLSQLPPERPHSFMVKVFPYTAMIVLHLSISTLLRIYSRLNASLKQQAETEAQKKTIELNLLKAQLNPHFFFNSLNTIYSLSIKKSSKTPEAILNLADLMRYMLYETNKEMVRLEQDIFYIENYIELQKLRLTSNNKVTFKVTGNPQGIMIPPLLFISFVENAFKYGVMTNGEISNINIEFTIQDDSIKFNVINDVNTNAYFRVNDTGLGIKNAVERIDICFPEKNIFYTKLKNGKFIVELTLFLK